MLYLFSGKNEWHVQSQLKVKEYFFENSERNWKISYELWKIYTLIWNKEKIACLIIFWAIILYYVFNNFTALSWKIGVFNIFNLVVFFSDLCYIAKYWNFDQIKLLTGSVCINHP